MVLIKENISMKLNVRIIAYNVLEIEFGKKEKKLKTK